MNNNLIFNGTRCELVKSFSTDWSFANYYLLPEEYRFDCEWEYTVESFAGERLYKYPETRKVVQMATYVRLTFRKEGGLHEVAVCDRDNVEILKRNITVPETLEKYKRIVAEAKDSAMFSIFLKESMELEPYESVSYFIEANNIYAISALCDEQGINCELTVDDEIVENVFVSEKPDVSKAIISLINKIPLTSAEKSRYQDYCKCHE